MNYSEMKFQVEALSGGKNTVILDDIGKPSIMVRVPKQTFKSLGVGTSDAVHPAWIVNGVEKDYIYIGKYQAYVEMDRAYSLPNMDPKASLNFDQAKTYCENKGKGWHLITNAEWAAIALWCKANGYFPTGNNNYGADTSKPYERGVRTYPTTGTTINRVGTGSGPKSWAHDNSNEGIFDMNGNVWEWCGGMRLNNGEIQIIKDNDAADRIDQTATSPLWKGILQDGSLVAPGTALTLKYNNSGQVATDRGTAVSSSKTFESIVAAASVTIPDLMKALALAPNGTGYEGDYFYWNNDVERLPLRGGDWYLGANAGVFALYLNNARSIVNTTVGFRLAYVEL